MSLRTCLPVSCFLLLGCSGPPPAPQPPEPPLVTMEKAVERKLDSFNEFTGYLKAVETQEIRAQVTGYIKRIAFKDGDPVKEGDVLIEIDPEPYDAALLNAQAQLEKSKADIASAQAGLDRANLDYDRAVKLRDTKSLSIEETDARKAARDSALATLEAGKASRLGAEAGIKKARFDRENCWVKSEVKGEGRVSRILLTKGNLVTAGQTLLCKVTSLDPIHAYWDVDEMTSLLYRKMIYDTKELADPRKFGLKCWIAPKDQADFTHEGKVDYIAPEIARGTGSREIRAVFDNKDARLSPGDSVRVKVEFGASRKYITVPEIAVGSQQRQRYVYVVAKDKDGKDAAEFRPVTLGPVRQVGAVRQQIVESGLMAGERVIVNGLLRVRPGAVVNAKEAETPAATK